MKLNQLPDYLWNKQQKDSGEYCDTCNGTGGLAVGVNGKYNHRDYVPLKDTHTERRDGRTYIVETCPDCNGSKKK
jgi:hypothetical protein